MTVITSSMGIMSCHEILIFWWRHRRATMGIPLWRALAATINPGAIYWFIISAPSSPGRRRDDDNHKKYQWRYHSTFFCERGGFFALVMRDGTGTKRTKTKKPKKTATVGIRLQPVGFVVYSYLSNIIPKRDDEKLLFAIGLHTPTQVIVIQSRQRDRPSMITNLSHTLSKTYTRIRYDFRYCLSIISSRSCPVIPTRTAAIVEIYPYRDDGKTWILFFFFFFPKRYNRKTKRVS